MIGSVKNSGLDLAIEHFGSQAKLAQALRVEPMAVTHWKKRGLPPKRAIEIEEATGGKVLRSDLLPEIFLSQDQVPARQGVG